jgi:3-deoxy-alpha-D-manno-octulosonate 8-oxidase
MNFRNFKMVGYVVYGRGAFNQLDEILQPNRKEGAPMVFLVDHFFEGKDLISRIPIKGKDKIVYADVTNEPKTTYVDAIAQQLKEAFGEVSGIIGIGGGSTMDLAKAVSLMMNNSGSSADYQGWDLVEECRCIQSGDTHPQRDGSRGKQDNRPYRPNEEAGHEFGLYTI